MDPTQSRLATARTRLRAETARWGEDERAAAVAEGRGSAQDGETEPVLNSPGRSSHVTAECSLNATFGSTAHSLPSQCSLLSQGGAVGWRRTCTGGANVGAGVAAGVASSSRTFS